MPVECKLKIDWENREMHSRKCVRTDIDRRMRWVKENTIASDRLDARQRDYKMNVKSNHS